MSRPVKAFLMGIVGCLVSFAACKKLEPVTSLPPVTVVRFPVGPYSNEMFIADQCSNMALGDDRHSFSSVMLDGMGQPYVYVMTLSPAEWEKLQVALIPVFDLQQVDPSRPQMVCEPHRDASIPVIGEIVAQVPTEYPYFIASACVVVDLMKPPHTVRALERHSGVIVPSEPTEVEQWDKLRWAMDPTLRAQAVDLRHPFIACVPYARKQALDAGADATLQDASPTP